MNKKKIPDYNRAAEKIFRAAVASVNTYNLTKEILRVNENSVIISDEEIILPPGGRIYVIGAGKATALMAKAVEEVLGSSIADGCISVKYGFSEKLSAIKSIEAGHPVPDVNSFMATDEILRIAAGANENDLVICLLSGGGSSLLADCPGKITAAEISNLNDNLVKSGADIREINIVRKHVSGVKGGRLAEMVYPARLISLILSDVPEGFPDAIASGPTYPDSSTFSDALDIIFRYGLEKSIGTNIMATLLKGAEGIISETPKPGSKIFDKVRNIILGSNSTAIHSAASESLRLGIPVLKLEEDFSGSSEQAAMKIVSTAVAVRDDASVRKPVSLIFGGETTVKVKAGTTGKGGRCQHLALAILALQFDLTSISILAAGSDGNDGPTEAAGAFANEEIRSSAVGKGLIVKDYLDSYDSYNFFRKAGGLLLTGPTKTNVRDIIVVIIA